MTAVAMAPALHREVIHASTPVDSVIFSESPWYEMTLPEQQTLQAGLVRRAVLHHAEACPAYGAYLERCGADPAAVALPDVPLVSTRLFKHAEIRSVPPEAIEQWYVSSGTGGLKSRIGRDRTSLERLIGSVRASLGLIEEWHEDAMTVINLGPGREDTGNVWFQYIMSLIELMYPTFSVVRQGVLEPEGVVDLLRSLLARDGHVGIVGPPFHVLDLCEFIRQRGIQVGAGGRLTVITAGGWKRRTGAMLPRPAFEQVVAGALELAGTDQLRDAFNQVELNTVFLECAAQEKHVPPWVFAAARHPVTLEPVAPGQIGLLSYLDASATSYPAFLVTDDVGAVHVGECRCGRAGTRVEVHRRLETRVQKGCALAMDKES